MPLLVIPNVSEGRDGRRVAELADALTAAGLRVLDVHTDAVHNRSVFTATGPASSIAAGAVALVHAASYIDLTQHEGVHPRLGGVDVFPVVPHETALDGAIAAARGAGRAVASDLGVPVYLYGAAAERDAALELPDLRRGGLAALIQRAEADLPPDWGPNAIDARRGVVCVGARETLIAFNVIVETDIETARAVARTVRLRGGPNGMRVLAFASVDPGTCQVSMNLTRPSVTGIDDAFDLVERCLGERSLRAAATEIVGLVPQRYLPAPEKKAARLLIRPGRSIEAALRS